MNFFFPILIASLLSFQAMAEKDAFCKFSEADIKVVGKTVKECDESARSYSDESKYGNCIGVTSWMIVTAAEERECVEKILNQLITNESFKLTSKTELQKVFSAGIVAECAQYNKCEGTMWHPIRTNCPTGKWIYLIDLTEKLIQNKLTLPEVSKTFAKTKKHINKKYVEFAGMICKLPAEVWKDQKIPSNCMDKVLSSLDYQTDVCEISE